MDRWWGFDYTDGLKWTDCGVALLEPFLRFPFISLVGGLEERWVCFDGFVSMGLFLVVLACFAGVDGPAVSTWVFFLF